MYIIMGVSGSGKTFLGKQLAKVISKPFYDADDFHSKANKIKMKSGHALNDKDRQPWLHTLANNINTWARDGGAILACSALKEDYRKKLSKGNNHITWIVLNGTFKIIQSRLKERKDHFFNPKLLKSQFDILELPNYGIHLNINQPTEVLIQSIFAKKTIDNQASIGVIGMGVMGQGIAINCYKNDFETAVYNRFVKGEKNVVFDFLSKHPNVKNLHGFIDLLTFIRALKRPRKIWLMIKSGTAIDALIDEILPFIDKNDVIIDGGNSHYMDTQRREIALKKHGINYVGCGVSGGEIGAREGASLMFGGSKEAYNVLMPILNAISAKDNSGKPCQLYVGADGAGHFVKMVHNGIEYAEMQLLAELYALLSNQTDYDEMASVFEKWNQGSEGSYLLEITSKILKKKEGSEYLLDVILDNAKTKGTGMWSAQSSLSLGVVNTMMSSAIFARYVSGMKEQREFLVKRKPPSEATKFFDLNTLKDAYRFARIINHIQGFNLIQAASKKYHWNYNPEEIARIWTKGCIIRSNLMEELISYFAHDKSLFKNDTLMETLTKTEPQIATLLHHAINQKVALDSFSSAYNYWISMCTKRLPANLIQAQRDFFGAHTYQRIDKNVDTNFHTKWY